MNDRIRRKLISIIRLDDAPISIPTLNQQSSLGLNMENNHEKNMLHEILNEISEDEHREGRPLLSSLVKIKPKGQGDNFYKLCERLGFGNWKDLKRDPGFLEQKIEECRSFWIKDENYKQYLD